MDDEKPFDLRDKLAIEILQALITYHKPTTSSFTGSDTAHYFLCCFDNKDSNADSCTRSMERLIRAAYKAADIMRKVRLSAFE